MNVTAIIPAAGKGLRFKSAIAKPLVILERKPILIHTLIALSRHKLIKEIIVVFNKQDVELLKTIINKFKIKKVAKVVPGGALRRQSVENGLKHVDKKCDIVLIHDGVRPFVDEKTISSVIKAAEKHQAAIAAVPVKPTIKRVNPVSLEVECTLQRDFLWEIQTPQAFKRDVILEAHNRFKDNSATDDAYLVEKMGVPVKVVKSSYKNIKITTPEDLIIAQAILKNKKG